MLAIGVRHADVNIEGDGVRLTRARLMMSSAQRVFVGAETATTTLKRVW